MFIDNIYKSSPVFLQNIMCSVKGWIICRRRYNKHFKTELNNYLSHAYNKELLLTDFLEAVQNVPAYRGIISSDEIAKCRQEKGLVYHLLNRFPLIGKNDVKAHISDFYNDGFKGDQIEMRTSGTTGSGLIFPYSVDMENKQWAVWWRYRIQLGISFDSWCGWFGGKVIMSPKYKKPPYWRINGPGHQVMFSSYHLTKNTVSCYAKEIERRNLTWLHGYPSSISRIASLMLEEGITPLSHVKFITTGAESIFDYQKDIIHKAFPNAMIRNHYGLSEGVANMSQDKNGEWHVDDDFAYVEFVPISENNPNECYIVGTGFCNLAFPLIRYNTGDIATIERKNGECRILSIDGRKDDYITLPNGVRLGRLGFIFKDIYGIKEAQIHQLTVNHVVISVVKNKFFDSSDEQKLKKEASMRFGEDVRLDVKYVDKIPRTKSGKLRLVISDIK